MVMTRRATSAPSPRPSRSIDEIMDKLESGLISQFSMDLLPQFVIVVEGHSDVDYLNRAADLWLEATGDDLLKLPDGVSEDGQQRLIVRTPGNPTGPERGGTKQMVRLAEFLQPHVFTLETFKGIVFVFDHDEEGTRAATQVIDLRFSQGRHVLTLDPAFRPKDHIRKPRVIEDLLSLRIQTNFFERGDAWCSVDYECGSPTRFHWRSESKGLLRDFVCENAVCDDMCAIVELLARIRTAIGLPVAKRIQQTAQ